MSTALGTLAWAALAVLAARAVWYRARRLSCVERSAPERCDCVECGGRRPC